MTNGSWMNHEHRGILVYKSSLETQSHNSVVILDEINACKLKSIVMWEGELLASWEGVEMGLWDIRAFRYKCIIKRSTKEYRSMYSLLWTFYWGIYLSVTSDNYKDGLIMPTFVFCRMCNRAIPELIARLIADF